MDIQETVCSRHEPQSRMELRSMHSSAARPDQLVGLYVCPTCGHEQRRPFLVEPV